MASLSGTSVPVVAKLPLTFRNRGGRQIYKENSDGDTRVTIVNAPPARTLASGSIVRDNGSVSQFEDTSWATYLAGRTTHDRVASHATSRAFVVDLGDNNTIAVVPTGLAPHIPQLGFKHTGNRVVTNQSVGDLVVERAANSGAL